MSVAELRPARFSQPPSLVPPRCGDLIKQRRPQGWHSIRLIVMMCVLVLMIGDTQVGTWSPRVSERAGLGG